MTPKQDFVDRILPHRLGAVEVLGFAIRFRSRWAAPVRMEILFDGKLSIEGLSSAFTNPAIEAGIIHCRALLEFLGLRVDKTSHANLPQRQQGRGDDLLIEQFSNAAGALPLVTPLEAVAAYRGSPQEAERALARVIHIANKGLAHSTAGLLDDPDDQHLVEIASRGVPALVVKHFYSRLGLTLPSKLIKERPREST